MRKALRNFAVANVFAVFPLLWAVLGWMPDQVKIRMRGWEEAPDSILANGAALAGEEYGEWSGGRVFRFYLRSGMEWEDLVFRFSDASAIRAVERVELQKWKLLSLGKQGSGLTGRKPGSAEFFFANPRFDSLGFAGGKVVWALAALEVLLAVLSWQCARHHREETWKKLLLQAIAVVLALTLLTQVALPIQSFWANRASYPFAFAALAGTAAWRFAWMSSLGIAAATLLARCFGRRVFGVVFALAVCIYLESGILSNGLANLNGDVFLLQDRTRALWDAAAWAAVFAVVLAAHPLLRKHYSIASLCLAAMVAASMFDTKREKLADKSRLLVHDFVPIETVIRSVTYSTNRNVMVFILDSLEREQAHAIMEDPEAGPKLREQFRGFTEYTNNVGALPQTLVAVPNLLTGRYPGGGETMADYSWSCYGHDSSLGEFLQTGHDVCMATPALGCGYTTRTNETRSASKADLSVLDCPGAGGDAWSVRCFTRWRCLPFAAKAPVSALTAIANPSEGFREWGVFPALERAEIDPASRGVFLWMHTSGVHVPTAWNRRGERTGQLGYSKRDCLEQGVFVLENLAKLMDFFREKGLYDNSLILVLGDHGGLQFADFFRAEKNGVLPENARPALWVKPARNDRDFATSGLPTSHARVSGLLKVAARNDLSEEEIQGLLRSEKRLYRRIGVLASVWKDWLVEADGTFHVEEHTNTGDAANSRPLNCGHKYPLRWETAGDIDADLSFNSESAAGLAFLHRMARRMDIDFRVPDARKQYILHLEFYDAEGGSLRFKCDIPDAKWEEFPVKPHGKISVHGVAADSSGMARVVCERADGPDVDVAFTSIMLEEEK